MKYFHLPADEKQNAHADRKNDMRLSYHPIANGKCRFSLSRHPCVRGYHFHQVFWHVDHTLTFLNSGCHGVMILSNTTTTKKNENPIQTLVMTEAQNM